MKIIEKIFSAFRKIRFIPHIIIYYTHPKREFLEAERNRWIKVIRHEEVYSFKNFLWLLERLPEYRSVLYWRLGKISSILKFLAPPQKLLHINIKPEKVGVGFVCQHGFSSIIGAITIGENCQIWHNVTVGTNKSGSGNKATIGNNVKISAGAILIGKVNIGNNVTIGAGSVVTKSVPNNCVVAGNPAHIISQNGIKVYSKL